VCHPAPSTTITACSSLAKVVKKCWRNSFIHSLAMEWAGGEDGSDLVGQHRVRHRTGWSTPPLRPVRRIRPMTIDAGARQPPIRKGGKRPARRSCSWETPPAAHRAAGLEDRDLLVQQIAFDERGAEFRLQAAVSNALPEAYAWHPQP
jgi:hypothetical protein